MSDPATALASASRNFSFLTGPAVALAADAAQAELYVYSDPDSALTRMRRFTETMAKLLMQRTGIGPDPNVQARRVTALARAGAIPPHMVARFDTVRRLANEATHEVVGDRAKALTALRDCFELAIWWYQTETGTTPAVAFTQPEPQDPRPLREVLESVEEHMAGLLARLDDSLARPEPRITIGEAVPLAHGWHGGAEVRCDSRTYLIHDPVEETTASDGAWRMLTAAARSLDGDSAAVRLRGLFLARPGPGADMMAESLRRQAGLAAGGAGIGLPRLVSHVDTGDMRIMVTARLAAPTWREVFGDGGQPLDSLLVPVALGVLADVAAALARLHGTGGHAHRALSGYSVLVTGSGRRGALRDLGWAGFGRLPGEGGPYPAPEQSALVRGRPGPATDVFQLAALLHHTCAGFPPTAGWAVPLCPILPSFPASLDRLLGEALAPDPARRPDMAALAAALKRGRHQPLPETVA